MDIMNYGGNAVAQVTPERAWIQVLGSGPYEYRYCRTRTQDEVVLADLQSFTVLVLEKPHRATVTIPELDMRLGEGDSVQAEQREVALRIAGGGVSLLIAGTVQGHPAREGLFVTRGPDHYKVSKPWGYELWLNGQHPRYAFKKIALRSGHRTSLQYHAWKDETNALVQGKARLHYKRSETMPNDQVSAADLGSVELSPVTTIRVRPQVLHRLEAVTDIVLFETSTPHLDDVIRVADDTQRPDGRIEEEHKT